ncbi:MULTISPECIES: FecR family protein [Butyricimonas]|uniref:FecR family protein n=1 Tax=Butyricimonas TaxID=574697 RepID=UPI000B38D0B8|nr:MULTISPECIES: FecR domain-containing protein [Butyricimonas]OUN67333.1 hypothetical protein B5G13_03635 [Butyricimonas sp. An62]
METERIDHIGKILRRFLTRGETVNWDELRVELGKDEYAHVKEELLRMRTMHVGVNRGRIWDKVQESLQQKVKRLHLFQIIRYAAILVLPLSVLLLFWLHQEKELPPMNVAVVGVMDSTDMHKVYLVLEGGTKVDLSTPHVDTIRQDDGQPLAVDTLGKLVYNTVQEEVEELSYHKIVVPRGGEYTVELNDGTRVRLNADSELRFPVKFVGNERKVFLKGEAYFEVERDTSRPFRVDVHGDAIIEVLGTEFNVNAYPENAEIFATLVLGKVRVADLQTDSTVVLLPNQQAALSGAGINVKEVNPEDFISWINGRFYFEKMPLEEILIQLGRWYDLQVFWVNEELKSYEFTGAIWRDNTIRQTLDMIEKTTDVCFTVSGRTVTVNVLL